MRRVTPEPGECTGHQGEAEGERGHRRPPPGWTLGWTPGTRACAPRATPSSLGKAFCSAAPAPWKPTIVGSPKLGRDACGGVGLGGGDSTGCRGRRPWRPSSGTRVFGHAGVASARCPLAEGNGPAVCARVYARGLGAALWGLHFAFYSLKNVFLMFGARISPCSPG